MNLGEFLDFSWLTHQTRRTRDSFKTLAALNSVWDSPSGQKVSSKTEDQSWGGSDGKEFACNAGDLGLILGLGRSPGEGKGYLLQYSGLENSKGLSLWASLIAQLVKNALAMWETWVRSLASITSHIHSWVFLLWLHLFILPGVISPLFSSSILGPYWPRVLLSVSSLFVFSYCSWGSQGKNTEMVCHSLLQWTTFCQSCPPWPSFLGWPYMAWLIVSLS